MDPVGLGQLWVDHFERRGCVNLNPRPNVPGKVDEDTSVLPPTVPKWVCVR